MVRNYKFYQNILHKKRLVQRAYEFVFTDRTWGVFSTQTCMLLRPEGSAPLQNNQVFWRNNIFVDANILVVIS